MKTAPFRTIDFIDTQEALDAYVAEVRADERERCAALAESYPEGTDWNKDGTCPYAASGLIRHGQNGAAEDIAKAIRGPLEE